MGNLSETKQIINAISEQYGGGDFETGLRKICQLSDEGKDLFGLKLNNKAISFSFKEVEKKITHYAIKHAHAWAGAIIETGSEIKI